MLLSFSLTEKGSPTTVTLFIEELENIPKLANTPYYVNRNNWKSISVIYKGEAFNQTKRLLFNYNGETDSIELNTELSEFIEGDTLSIVRVRVEDKADGFLLINRDEIPDAEDLDILFNEAVDFIVEGLLDVPFVENAVDGTKFNGDPFAQNIVVQSNGKILVGGAFTSYAGTSGRNYLVRLNVDGTIDTSFCNNAVDGSKFNNVVYSISVQPDGKILVGGDFTSYAGTSGRNYLVRLNSDGTLDTVFCNNAVDGEKIPVLIGVSSTQQDNKVLIGGGAGSTIIFRRLNEDGTTDTSFQNNLTSFTSEAVGSRVWDIKIQPDGKILVCGGFINYQTSNQNRLIRLNNDGTLDSSFTTNASASNKFNSIVRHIALQPDGKIVVVGDFTPYGGISGRNMVIRLNSDGTLDTAFCNNAVDGSKFNSSTYTALILPNSKIAIGGIFFNYAGVTGRDRFVILNADGTLDTSFCNNAVDGSKFNNPVFGVAVNAQTSTVLVGGNFTNYAGTTGRNRLIRLV
jgi:uncharacterized delta-60 repeat protein